MWRYILLFSLNICRNCFRIDVYDDSFIYAIYPKYRRFRGRRFLASVGNIYKREYRPCRSFFVLYNEIEKLSFAVRVRRDITTYTYIYCIESTYYAIFLFKAFFIIRAYNF